MRAVAQHVVREEQERTRRADEARERPRTDRCENTDITIPPKARVVITGQAELYEPQAVSSITEKQLKDALNIAKKEIVKEKRPEKHKKVKDGKAFPSPPQKKCKIHEERKLPERRERRLRSRRRKRRKHRRKGRKRRRRSQNKSRY